MKDDELGEEYEDDPRDAPALAITLTVLLIAACAAGIAYLIAG